MTETKEELKKQLEQESIKLRAIKEKLKVITQELNKIIKEDLKDA